jgi:hypothetical protein
LAECVAWRTGGRDDEAVRLVELAGLDHFPDGIGWGGRIGCVLALKDPEFLAIDAEYVAAAVSGPGHYTDIVKPVGN